MIVLENCFAAEILKTGNWAGQSKYESKPIRSAIVGAFLILLHIVVLYASSTKSATSMQDAKPQLC